MRATSLLLALLLAGCTSEPTAPARSTSPPGPGDPATRHTLPLSPSDPVGVQRWYDGYYTDGASWLDLGKDKDEALIVGLIGDTVRFHIYGHDEYIVGTNGESWMLGLYDDERRAFWVDMNKVTDERQEYVSRLLKRREK